MDEKQAIGPKQESWLTALESGEHQQCKGTLGMVVEGRETNCCLGVWCKVSGSLRSVREDGVVLYDGFDGVPAMSVWKDLGLRSQDGDFCGMGEDTRCIGPNGSSALTLANDGGATFAEIAAFCRARPEAVFEETR